MKVIVKTASLASILDRVVELREQGLVQHRDFDFEYRPRVTDEYSYTTVEERHTIFTFHTELGRKHASLFALKWT